MVQPRGGKRQQRGEDKQKGQDLPEFTVAGCRRTRRQVHREVTEEKSKMEEGEQQMNRDQFPSLLDYFTGWSSLVPPSVQQLQNFLGPQAEACFRVTPVPNVGKSSGLLMSGA